MQCSLATMVIRCIWMCVIVTSGFLVGVEGQCDNSTMNIRGGNDWIRSPNHKNTEYGKSANCSWELNSPLDGKEHAILLKFTWLELFIEKNGRHCLGSYNLTINHEQIECDRYAFGSTLSYTKAYFNSTICTNNSEVRMSEDQEVTSMPIDIKYFSDGQTDPDVSRAVMGFDIAYKFIDCSTGRVESEICDASGRQINNQTDGTIQAKGNKNCSWEFSPPSDGKEYAIKYHMDFLDLECDAALTIDEESFTCERKVRYSEERFCKAYYSSPICEALDTIQDCQTLNQTSYPLVARYSGGTNSYGFVIRYEFLECPAVASSSSFTIVALVLMALAAAYGVVITISCCRERRLRKKGSKYGPVPLKEEPQDEDQAETV